jgi:hypothetical protein
MDKPQRARPPCIANDHRETLQAAPIATLPAAAGDAHRGHPWLGEPVTSLSSWMAKSSGMPSGSGGAGYPAARTAPGSPAAQPGGRKP